LHGGLDILSASLLLAALATVPATETTLRLSSRLPAAAAR
jgi:hypothetical protein